VSKEVKEGKQLYTLAEVAKFCGRSYHLLRYYYAYDLIPDPINTTKFSNGYKIRKFTYMEARNLRDFFKTVQPGSIARLRRSAEARKSKSAGRKVGKPQ
jgi:hypothetical protein